MVQIGFLLADGGLSARTLGHATLVALGVQLYYVTKNKLIHRFQPQTIVFWLGGLATFVILNISGVIREEITRLWIFLGSFAMIGVAITFAVTPVRVSTLRVIILANLFITAIANRIIGFLTW